MKNLHPLLFGDAYRIEDVIDNFLRTFFSQQLNYMASDLLNRGFTPKDILDALEKAMQVCRTAKMPLENHFMPLYSDHNGVTIRDCKLSLTGFRLLLLNANPSHPATANFQMKLLEKVKI